MMAAPTATEVAVKNTSSFVGTHSDADEGREGEEDHHRSAHHNAAGPALVIIDVAAEPARAAS
jgi:hypothetical protein